MDHPKSTFYKKTIFLSHKSFYYLKIYECWNGAPTIKIAFLISLKPQFQNLYKQMMEPLPGLCFHKIEKLALFAFVDRFIR